MSLLPVEPAWRLAERAEEQRWLVAGLWSEQAVGIVGGEPKCCKSFLALDLAVAVASGTPCLRRSLDPIVGSAPPQHGAVEASTDLPPLLARMLDRQAASGLPPPYLPKDEEGETS